MKKNLRALRSLMPAKPVVDVPKSTLGLSEDAGSGQENSPILMKGSTLTARVVAALAAMLALMLGLAVTVPYPMLVQAPAVLVSKGGLVALHAPSDSKVLREILAKPGDRVLKGQPLFVLSTADYTAFGDVPRAAVVTETAILLATEKEQALLESARQDDVASTKRAKASLDRETTAFEEKLKIIGQQRALALALLNKQQELVAAELTPKQTALEAEARLLGLDSQLADAQQQRQALLARVQQASAAVESAEKALSVQMLTGKRAIASSKQKVEERRIATEQVIQAPFDGVIGAVLLQEGQHAVAGEPLAYISASGNPIAVEAYVPPERMSGLQVGQTAALALDAYADRRYRRLPAKVEAIDLVPQPSGSLLFGKLVGTKLTQGGSVYRVSLQLTSEANAAMYAEVQRLPGAPGTVYIQTKSQALLKWLLPDTE